MLQPVAPYTLVGLALGSFSKNAIPGAIAGTLFGLVQTAKGAGSSEFGLPERDFYTPPPVARPSGPSTVTDMASAKRAAKFAVQQSGKSGEPWRGASTPGDVLRMTLRSKLALRQRAYLIRLLGAYRKRTKTASEPSQAASPYLAPKRASVPIQGPREDTAQYISEPGSAWWKTTQGKIGLAAVAGVGSLILILLLTGKRK